MIIAGHGRFMAATQLGLEQVPVMVAEGWTSEQVRAYVLADNKLAENAGWDEDLLRLEIGELNVGGFDLGLAGFSDEELAELFAAPEGKTDPDDVPEPLANPVSRIDDVWLLGSHRMVCGDCTDAAVVEALLAGELPQLMVTDPPYGVQYDASWRVRAGVNMATAASGKVLNDDRADWRAAWALFPGDVAYVWHAGLHAGVVAESLQSCGFTLRSQIVWAKSQMVMSRGDYHWQHEPCWYAVRDGKAGQYEGGRKQTTLWDIAKPAKSETGHSTQKPVACMRRPIENNSKPGDYIYEPFSGSGTTIIAAQQTGRRCLAIELNPIYVDVAVRRWEEYAGRKATLQGTTKSFADVADERYDWRKDGLASYEEWISAKRAELVAAS